MNLLEPFIVENGAALFFPARYRGWDLAGGVRFQSYVVFKLGVSYAEVRAFVKRRASRFGIKGFGDWSVEEIAEITGLPPEKVGPAKEREFTEPFLPGDEKKMEELRRLALKEGIAITRGGMFYHLIGPARIREKPSRSRRDCSGVIGGTASGSSASETAPMTSPCSSASTFPF